eukprot:1985983-Lingulodinium_polyedra.AAC.1
MAQMAGYGPSKLQRERARALAETRTMENNRKCHQAYNKALRLAATVYVKVPGDYYNSDVG